MADFDTAEFRASRFSRSRADDIADRTFPVAMRGYDRAAVDAFLQEVVQVIADLESRQSQESVVQRAIAEVGEETAGILQRAHETAEEIAARSRAQAEGRIQRAEREAELLRQEADSYSEKIVYDTRVLWEERQRLIEDIRQLADDVLGTADDAGRARLDAADAERARTPSARTSRPRKRSSRPRTTWSSTCCPAAPADNGVSADEDEPTV